MSVNTEAGAHLERGRPQSSVQVQPPARAKRALLTALAGWIQTVVTVVTGFIATPFLLQYLGAERLGAFHAGTQWAGYLGVLNLGLSGALGVLVLRAWNSGSVNETAGVIKKGLRLEFKQSLLILPFALALAWALPLLVPVQETFRSEMRLGGAIGFVGLVLLVPFGIFRTLLECAQRGYIVNLILVAQSLVTTGLAVGLAWAGYGLIGQFAAPVCGVVVFAAAAAVVARRYVPLRSDIPPAMVPRRELWSLRWPLSLTGIGLQLNAFTDNIVIAALLGPVWVTTFMLTQRLVAFAGTMVSMVGAVSWAGLAELRAAGLTDLFQQRVLELVRLLVGMGIVLVGTVALYNRSFVRLWVGEEFYGGDVLTLLIALQVVISGFLVFFAWVIDTQGDTRERVVVSNLGSAINLALSIGLGILFGLSGVIFATVTAYLLTEAWYSPRLFCRRYGVSSAAIANAVTRGVLLAAPWVLGVGYLTSIRPAHAAWMEFIMEFAAVGATSAVYGWFIVLTKTDRQNWRGRLRQLVSFR